MRTRLAVISLGLIGVSPVLSQSSYTDRGHWVGIHAGYVPSSDRYAVSPMYEYRFHQYWSTNVHLTALHVPTDFAIIVAANLRLRIPVFAYASNFYGQVGIGSGSMYPVLNGSIGLEYSVVEKVSAFIQYRRYTSNFDGLSPVFTVYLLGINVDVTPALVRQGYMRAHDP